MTYYEELPITITRGSTIEDHPTYIMKYLDILFCQSWAIKIIRSQSQMVSLQTPQLQKSCNGFEINTPNSVDFSK